MRFGNVRKILLALLLAAIGAPAQTRMFFPLDTAADVSPGFDLGWSDSTEGVRRKWVSAKGASAITVGQVVDLAAAGNTADLDRQYVSAPLAGAQTVSGTVKGVLMTREYAGTDNVDSITLILKVVSNDGGTLRCTLLALGDYFTRAEFVNNATHRNKRIADGDSITSCSALDGDRLVVEVGYKVASGGGTTPQVSAKWGENAADCAENETNTANCAGWFELSATLTFQGPAGKLFVLPVVSH